MMYLQMSSVNERLNTSTSHYGIETVGPTCYTKGVTSMEDRWLLQLPETTGECEGCDLWTGLVLRRWLILGACVLVCSVCVVTGVSVGDGAWGCKES